VGKKMRCGVQKYRRGKETREGGKNKIGGGKPPLKSEVNARGVSPGFTGDSPPVW
jgi:hypothetical protein